MGLNILLFPFLVTTASPSPSIGSVQVAGWPFVRATLRMLVRLEGRLKHFRTMMGKDQGDPKIKRD